MAEGDETSDDIPVADFLGDRGIVWDSRHGTRLYSSGFFGQPVGIRKPKSPEFDRPLELSLLECAYLVDAGMLRVIDVSGQVPMTVDDLIRAGLLQSEEFYERFLVYKDLRRRGFVVRPGLKFGTDFAVYEHGPGIDHAPFLVHVIPQRKGVQPIDMVRAGRLATSVRKKFIIATVKESEEITYYSFVWHRP